MSVELGLLLLVLLGFTFCVRKTANQFPTRVASLIFWNVFVIGLVITAVAGSWTITRLKTTWTETR